MQLQLLAQPRGSVCLAVACCEAQALTCYPLQQRNVTGPLGRQCQRYAKRGHLHTYPSAMQVSIERPLYASRLSQC